MKAPNIFYNEKAIATTKSFLLTAFLSTLISCSFAPGSYPYAEAYELNVNEPTLIEAVQKFKRDNPEYIVPEQVQLKDGRNGNDDNWHHLYFYYLGERKIIYTCIRSISKGTTTLALVSINDGLTLGNWKDINKDFNHKENEEEKKRFETRILNKIKENL